MPWKAWKRGPDVRSRIETLACVCVELAVGIAGELGFESALVLAAEIVDVADIARAHDAPVGGADRRF